MTNEEARRKSGRDMEFNRQQSGRDMEESRRASGRKMRDDMRALAENNRLERTLPVLPIRGAQQPRRGTAAWSGGAPTSSGVGGIASPLTEPRHASRTYYNKNIFLSGSFLIGMELKPIKDIKMQDANGFDVTMTYAEPPDV